MTAIVRPRIVLSRCLEHDACRYDGQMIRDDFVARLREHVDYVTVCPEMSIGLGVPRDTIRLVDRGGALPALHQPATDRDLTEDMARFSQRWLGKAQDVDGFILKSRSPSCGIRDAKVHPDKPGPSRGKASGVFARHALDSHAGLAIEDEGRLRNYQIREHFLTKVFLLAEFRELRAEATAGKLVAFHTRHKLQLMAHNQTRMRRLGRLVANLEKRPLAEIVEDYAEELRAAFARIAPRRSQINVLQHLLGYFKRGLEPAEKRYFLDALERYRASRLPLSSMLSIVRAHIVRFDESYLAGQSYLEPYPEELVVMRDSGKGREF